MPRGYWSLGLAAFGWLILAASAPNNGQLPKQGEQRNQPSASPQQEIAANTIATAIDNTISPPEYQASCEQGNDQRESDLCAQWKAADAANRAAYWAAWSVFIGSIGAAFLVWTFLETRRTGRRELRAYVGIKEGIPFAGPVAGVKTAILLTAINRGQTPARDVRWKSYITVTSIPLQEGALVEPDVPWLSRHDLGKDQITTSEPELSTELTAAHVAGIAAETWAIFLYGLITYKDVFGAEWTTRYRYFWNPRLQKFIHGDRGNEST